MTARLDSSAHTFNSVDVSLAGRLWNARVVEAAGMSMPFDAQSPAGGDWWDLVEAPRGELVVIFGDAMGHDLQAASQARWLSTFGRWLVEHGQDDQATLRRLDDALRMDAGSLAAVVLARLRADTGQLQIVQAGHVPVICVHDNGQVEEMPALIQAPLGAGVSPDRAPVVRLREGDTLLFASDGVMQRRQVSLESGLMALRVRLGAYHDRALHQLCAAALCTLDEPLEDDATVLALRWPACERDGRGPESLRGAEPSADSLR